MLKKVSQSLFSTLFVISLFFYCNFDDTFIISRAEKEYTRILSTCNLITVRSQKKLYKRAA